jgi:hypothetical protein
MTVSLRCTIDHLFAVIGQARRIQDDGVSTDAEGKRRSNDSIDPPLADNVNLNAMATAGVRKQRLAYRSPIEVQNGVAGAL